MSTPQTPPARTPSVKSSEEYFNSSRLKVIGLITAATVAVGALGGIAGVAFDPDPVTRDNVIQPGGDGSSVGSPGSSSPRSGGGFTAHRSTSHPSVSHASVSQFTSRLPDADATESPSSVGSISPGGGGFSESPSDQASDAPSDGSSDQPSDGDSGSGVTLSDTGVDIYVPPGWTVDNQSGNQVYLSNGEGSYAFAFSGGADSSTAAGDLITQNLDSLLPPDTYTQRATSDVVPLEAFGSVVSIAAIEYEALWVDNQGSISIHGQLYVGVRQDGTVLGIEIERMPAEDFESAVEELVPVVDNSFTRFAGLG
jgi:hypothetical protein